MGRGDAQAQVTFHYADVKVEPFRTGHILIDAKGRARSAATSPPRVPIGTGCCNWASIATPIKEACACRTGPRSCPRCGVLFRKAGQCWATGNCSARPAASRWT